jgi:hypothetical protein
MATFASNDDSTVQTERSLPELEQTGTGRLLAVRSFESSRSVAESPARTAIASER